MANTMPFLLSTGSTIRLKGAHRTARSFDGKRLASIRCSGIGKVLSKMPSNRSEVDAITLFHQVLELVKNPEDLSKHGCKEVPRYRMI